MPTYECPTCRKLVRVQRREEAPYRPFCSERCKMTDLGAWMDGTYRIEEPLVPDPRDDWEGESTARNHR